MKARHLPPDRKFGQVKNSVMILCSILIFFLISLGYSSAFGVVGCTCNDPDRDIARLFPESTGYRVIYKSINNKGGEKLLDTVETRLGAKDHGDYRELDESSTIYEVLSGKKKIGYLHGVNQKGQVGSFQVFLALDPQGTITGFFTRKMTNRCAAQMRDTSFEEQFIGLTIKDFEQFDVVSGKSSGKVEGLKNPVPEAQEDFTAILKAIKKNLILMDEVIFHRQDAQTSHEAQL
jgi:hypothetical protein